MRLLIATLVLASGTASAEMFSCQPGTQWNDAEEAVVHARIDDDGQSGTVRVAGVTHRARVTREGIDRRWDFDLGSNHVYRYAFVISPDGVGHYYDFSGKGPGQTVTPAKKFVCR